jgi:hypothetical protein
MTFNVGDRVYFGRTNGEKSLGEVVKVNRKSLKVKLLEERGARRSYTVGGTWRVPPSLCTLADGDCPADRPAAVPSLFKVGDSVWFEGLNLTPTTLEKGLVNGVVTKVNSNGTCEIFGVNYGPNTRTVNASDMSLAAPRSEETIRKSFNAVYGALSPENLYCDGEASRSEVRRKSAVLNRALKALTKENGCLIPEGESYGY